MRNCVIPMILCFLNTLADTRGKQENRGDRSVDKDEGKSSLVFVFDTTGSMLDDLKQLRAGAEMILKTALEDSNIIADFVFVPFHDPSVGPPTVTKDKDVFKATLNRVDVYGGGDCPEKSLGGIHMALAVSRPRSFIYVFTDATATDHNIVGKVLDAIQRKQSQVVFVLTGHCNDLARPTFKVYQQIAAASSGQIFNLNKTNVHNMLDFVRSSIRGRNVNLVSAARPAGVNFSQEIPVDSSVGEVTVSVSGGKPKIKVVNPEGKELVGPPKLIKTLDLSEIMIVKVMEPEPGNWTISVGSEKDYSVKVSGLSNLTFNHGFSVEKPKSFEETSYRPLQGTYNHLLLSPTQPELPLRIDFIEILTTDGKSLFEVPIKESNNGMFLAEAFLPPENLFYIAVNGHDESGQEWKRIGATAVQAKPPSVPYLTAPKKIQAHSHERVILKCYVESLVPVTVKWSSKFSSTLTEASSLRNILSRDGEWTCGVICYIVYGQGVSVNIRQSTSVDYVIDDMTEANVGMYQCSANNAAGKSNIHTYVTILVDPPQVTVLPANESIPFGENLTVVCSVFSEALLLKAQIIFNGTDRINVTKYRMTPTIDGFYNFNKTFANVTEKERGTYTCVASNRGGEANQSIYITIQDKPTAQIIGPHTVNKKLYGDMQLVCQIEQADKIQWLAPNGTVVKELPVNGSLTSILDVNNVTDEGTWSCIAIKNPYKASDAIQLNILIKPIVSIAGEKSLMVMKGDTIQIECTVHAKPQPRIVWHKETEVFLNCTIDQYEPNVYKSVLTVNSSAEHINGTYFCFGENSAGISHDSVTVEERTKMILTESFSDQLVELYDSVEMRCATESYPLGTVTLYHNGTKISPNLIKEIPGGALLRLPSVNFSQLGHYECQLDNGYESLRVEGTLQVTGLESPVLSKEPSSISVVRGDTAILTCRILMGNPEPNVTWQYRSEEMEGYRDIPSRVLVNDKNREIRFQNTTIKDVGLYRCIAENDVGRDIYETSLNVQYPPHIKEPFDLNQTNSSVVEVGKKMVFSCQAEGNPLPVVLWTKERTSVPFSDNIYLTDTNDLVIENITINDSGVYSCNVSSRLGSVGKNFTLQVFMTPEVVHELNTELDMLVGQLVELTCPVKGAPTPRLQWFHNGEKLKASSRIDGPVLSFVANLTDFGEYSCNASNEYGSVALNYTLHVWDPPHIKEPSGSNVTSSLAVEAGKKMVLSCPSAGNPPPIVLWTKEWRPVPFSDNIYLTDTNDLVIENVTIYDSGIYNCNVTSRLGSVGKNFTLQVFMKPEVIDKKLNTEIEVLEGQLVELVCPAKGAPTPRLKWSHNGGAVKPSARIDGQILRFVANLTDFGEYSCNASNEYGSAVLNYSLYVWVTPYIRPPFLESRSIKIGSNASLQCNAVGFPLPIIVWQFNGELLLKNNTSLSFNEIGNLNISNANSTHEGEYECIAENLAGSASRTIMLHVNEPPQILQDNYTGSYEATVLDTALVIACEVTGKPTPYVMWSKDEYYLDTDSRYDVGADGTLTIKYPSEELSGEYTCTASNSAGNASRTVSVQIYSVPILPQSEESQTVVTVVEGTNASVQCPVLVSPKDTIKWYKDAKLISEGTLDLNPVKRIHASQYACVGKNAAGAMHASVTIQVHWPPALHQTILDDSPNDFLSLNKSKYIYPPNQTLENIPSTSLHSSLTAIPLISDTGNTSRIPSVAIPLSTLKYEAGLPVYDVLADPSTYPYHFTPPSHFTSPNTSKFLSTVSKYPHRVHLQLPRGEDLHLDCSVDAKPRVQTKWYFNSKLLLGEDKNFLKVLNMQLHNAGIYKCVAANKYGAVFKEFSVDVLDPPFISEFDLLDVTLKEGANASLECRARGSPKPEIKWTFNNTGWRVLNKTLISENVSAESEGIYRCDAINAAGIAHLVYRVTVVAIAKIKSITAFNGSVGDIITGRLEIALGSRVRIACAAYGRPIPNIQWIRHGNVVSTNTEHIGYADLIIKRTETSDAGQYTCVASNEGGMDEESMKLEILESPRILRTVFQDNETPTSGNVINLEVISGQAFYMHCHPYGNPMPEIYWFKDDVPLRLFDGSMITSDYGEIIQSPSAKYEQSGNYTCVARNKAGETALIYLVDVLVPPVQPKDAAKDVSTRLGKHLTLTCPIQGSPMPYIMWMKHPYNELSEETPRVHLTEDNVTLTVESTVTEDSGIYSCVMTNKVGTSEVTFNVVVEMPPSITGDAVNVTTEEHVVALRRSIVLKCEVNGHPPPKISWLKDILAVSEGHVHVQRVLGGSILGVWGAEARDAGQYICVAENTAGTASRRYNVRVKVPGKWSTWSQWSYCNVTCGTGYQNRSRLCQYLDDDNTTIDSTTNSDKLILDESSCKGPRVDRRKCHMPSCEDENGWSSWSRWSICSATCGVGTQARRRRCRSRTRCSGDNVQIRKCPDLPKCREIYSSQESNETDMYTPDATIEMSSEENMRRSSDFEEFSGNTYDQARQYFDVNVTENLDHSPQGPCKPGFRHNKVDDSCNDVDECAIESNHCHSTQVCTNLAGRYRCSCTKGFQSLGVGRRCLDINECEQGIHGCEFACVNTAGGYVCACPRHLRLHIDRHHCVPPPHYKTPLPYYADNESDDYLTAAFDTSARYAKYHRFKGD